MLSQDSFAAIAAERAMALPRAGESMQLTMVKVDHLDRALKAMSELDKKSVLESVGRILKSASFGGNLAGRIDNESFCLVHARGGVDEESLTQKIEDAANSLTSGGPQVSARSTTVEADPEAMSEEQLAKAVAHAMNKFCTTGGSLKGGTLTDILPAMMTDTFNRIDYLKSVCRKHDLDIVFMPICDLREGKLHHFEGLTRFRDSIAGVSPYHLICLAEEMDLIYDLDMAIIMKTIQILGETPKMRTLPPVAVNLSGASITNIPFVNKLHKLLATDSTLPKRLMLEITESARIEQLEEANRIVQTFRKKGFIVCIDDFGAGAASIDYLHMLDIDVVKFDGPVVKRACSSQKGRDLLSSMARICADMKIETVAEMIEDRKMATQAAECGVNFGQGYLYGKPGASPFQFLGRKGPGA
ncbi:MAG: EAL domain-containing protein [Alphaproteobacteria bacterium]